MRLANQRNAAGGGMVVNSSTTNIITTPNPAQAGNVAAKNTATATTKAIKSIPTTKLGTPITAPGRP
jgi:hypothetical protein